MFILFLIAFLVMPRPAAADDFWRKVSWTGADNVILAGLYHPATRSKAYTWVLLHGLGSGKMEWDGFAHQMAQDGMGIFLYDARGHGESIRLANGDKINYQQWLRSGPGTPWDGMTGDLVSAVEEVRKHYHVSEKMIAIGGASLGANIALIYTSSHKRVPALIILSSGIEYAGHNIVTPWVQMPKRPVFAAASPQDLPAYSTLRFLTQQRPDMPITLVEGQGAEHGVNMFKIPGFTDKLLSWMKKAE